jgi:hypothetical protein
MKITNKVSRPDCVIEMSYEEFMAIYHFIGNSSTSFRMLQCRMREQESELLSLVYRDMFDYAKEQGIEDE